MKTSLFDVNLLLALAWPDHEHHEKAHQWLKSNQPGNWATCMLTQLGFIRISSHPKFTTIPTSPGTAYTGLKTILKRKGHVFWQEPTQGFKNPILMKRFQLAKNHADLSDAYLAALAELHGGILVTFDRRLAADHSDVTELIE